MNKNESTMRNLSHQLQDPEIDYQKITDITFAVANERDILTNEQVGNGRNAGNRFESALRYSLALACHDVSDPENKSKSDIRFNGVNEYYDLQVKRYQPGFAQVSTMAGSNYYTAAKNLYDSNKKSGKTWQSYFTEFDLPPDFLMVQNNRTGNTKYYLFEVESLSKNTRNVDFVTGKTCDKIRLLDKNNTCILEIRSGENPQANCLTRGTWVNTEWLSQNVKPIKECTANVGLNINKILFGY